ncbi:PREDICTED: speckle targeted PIP5K1A-regulated poly(A) polymerase [Nanorana parkeri]|uniref:speckle targeted PIP5K1A-regulated poly(A) polymerase n=1 Tax=Nanorana parkeri TaxID=125878 RepID=UPI0008543A7A|nr:PREDICTED: speckle targeted PIP5K1A-regulated poly(A) polymerase [Nanorana parkeri]
MASEEDEGCSLLSSDIQPGDRGSFRCLLCGVSVPNRPSLNDHVRGRRHVRMCEERDKRQQQQERSVFVSGFPKGTTEDQLTDVFQSISSVKNIVMDKDRGLYAIVEFENSDGVTATLEEPNIKLEGHQLKVKPREKKEFKKKRTGSRNLQPPDPEALSKELIHCKDVEDQIKSLVTLCSPSHHEGHLRELLLSLLRETFTEFFPGCQLHPFGSSVNGFEVSGCDLDLYLELGETEELNRKNDDVEDADLKEDYMDKDTKKEGDENEVECLEVEEAQRNKINETEEIKHDEEHKHDEDENITPGLSLKGLSNEEILDLVERVLRQCVPGVHGVQTVPSARRPVIRFQHKTSGLRGDITLNNRLALRNSYYLRLCSDLDPRVPQLVYTLRYWARVNQLAGNSLGGGPLLNNYALTLLIIFFLQSRSPLVIPSLSQLRVMAVDEDTHIIDGWDCTFPSDPTQIQPSKNEQSLGCLLSEFFSFFSSLDLRSSILCPRDGVIITLPFTSPTPSWAEGFRLGPFNVQDPFELSHNVCSNVSLKTARRFSSQCIGAAKTCRSPLYRLRSLSRPWGIVLLLLANTSEGSKKEGIEISIPLTGTSLEAVILAVKRVLVEVLLCSCEEEASLKNRTEKTGGGKGEMERSGDEGEQAVSHMEGLVIGDESEFKDGMKTESHGRKRESTEEIQNDNKRRKMEGTNEDAIVEQDSVLPTQKVHKGQEAKKLKELAKENISLVRLNVWHQVWEGRRRQRRSKCGEVAQKIELETAVSHALSSGAVDGKPCKPLMQITIKTELTNEGNLQLHLTPEVDDYQCSTNFLHFLKGFLPQMVQEVLNGHD